MIDKILPTGIGQTAGERVNVPEGLWHKCVKREAVLYRPDLENNQYVCPNDHHMRIRARERLSNFLDMRLVARFSLRLSLLINSNLKTSVDFLIALQAPRRLQVKEMPGCNGR